MSSVDSIALVSLDALQERILCELPQWTSEWDWRNAKVLDIGSRFGHRTNRLYEQLAPLRIESVRGVDADVRGVEFAMKNLAHEKLDFSYIADFEDRFPLKYSSTFDWVLHINPTLFYLNNQESALRNFLWCLKPGGKALIALPAELPSDITAVITKIFLKKASKQLNQWMLEALDVRKKVWFEHPQADKIYTFIIERCGFNIHRSKLMDFSFTFENKNEHKASLETFFYDAIMSYPEDQRDSLLNQIYALAHSKMKKSRWTFRFVLILASRPDLSCSVCSCKSTKRFAEEPPTRPPPRVPVPEPQSAVIDEGDNLGELSVEVVHNESDDNEGLDDDAVIDIEAENTDYALRGKAEFALGADSDSAHGEDVDLAENEGYTVIGETEESEHDSD